MRGCHRETLKKATSSGGLVAELDFVSFVWEPFDLVFRQHDYFAEPAAIADLAIPRARGKKWVERTCHRWVKSEQISKRTK